MQHEAEACLDALHRASLEWKLRLEFLCRPEPPRTRDPEAWNSLDAPQDRLKTSLTHEMVSTDDY